ncbi:hypothetical protein PanWU01x14_025480 [Parasponia andersonii]|uniref:Transmembrane protein n=1 Tax=Parasponia andersonii TaxID=3476 RepID=A0A2P5DWZ9_PARAD|nr:hypothetical protein PanWU01x14_025480 [Parasponia andersonii]
MIGRFLAWFLVVSLTCNLSSMALKVPSELDYYNPAAGFNLSKPIFQEAGKNYDRASLNHTKFEESAKIQKGKGGVYGGANVNHRPRPIGRNSASLPARIRPSLFVVVLFPIFTFLRGFTSL